jgi:hypothetical protein
MQFKEPGCTATGRQLATCEAQAEGYGPTPGPPGQQAGSPANRGRRAVRCNGDRSGRRRGRPPVLRVLAIAVARPGARAVLLNPARIALVGALAAAMSLPLAGYDGLLGSRQATVALATIAGVTAAGAIASAGRLRRERDLATVRAVADAVKRILLRPVPGLVGGVSAAVGYVSASASAQVGGDLYGSSTPAACCG